MNARKIASFAVFAAIGAAVSSPAEDWHRTPDGVEFRLAESPIEAWPENVALLRFDPAAHRLRVVAGVAPGRTAASLLDEAGVVAAVNASVTSADGCPTGWLVRDGEQLQPLKRQLGAVLSVSAGGRVELMSAFRVRDLEPEQAVQGGLMVAIEGFANPALRRGLSRRAFAALDREGRVVLGVTRGPVHPMELASWLTRGDDAGGVGALEVMELGGGDQAQLFVRDAEGEGEHHLDESARPVPVLLVVEAAGP